jgi:4-hydroxy-tetrahydrodipicolinate reductase
MEAEGTMEQAPHKIRVAVSGALGQMGRATCVAVAADAELVLAAAVDPALAGRPGGPNPQPASGASAAGTLGAEHQFVSLEAALEDVELDVVVDFTVPAAVRGNVLACLAHRTPVVVGTTGLSTAELDEIAAASLAAETPVLVAPNVALGAVIMMLAARLAAGHMRACEIVELHHDRKLDAPSGTAKLTRSLIEETWREAGLEREVPIHSVRLPGLVAHQEVIFGGVAETLTIRHDSLSREAFMPGVLLAIKRVRSLQGLVVGLENLL